MLLAIFSGKWALNPGRILISALSFIVFLILDLLDFILCIFYRFMDGFWEGQASPCYCEKNGEQRISVGENEEGELSETLYRRENVFREMGFLGFSGKWENSRKIEAGKIGARWSDCGCQSCLSWMSNGEDKLHVCISEPTRDFTDTDKDSSGKPAENVIFLHGFLCSSSFWREAVFPNLSEPVKQNHRLFAVDLLGFGRSPKPRNCFYTIKDHLEMIEKSVICPFQLNSFHLVAHSMGCIIAIALAAKYSKSVKSITLVAPPFFPLKDRGDVGVLEKLVEKRLWPPLKFGSAVMSWYEHVGRSVCFLVCRNHRTWERIVKLLTRRRDLHYMTIDLPRHTHHSGWHTMHNVICGGAKLMGGYLKVLTEARVKISVVHGDKDQVVPMECCNTIKAMAPHAEVDIIRDANHSTVILGRKKEFARYLEYTWLSSQS
ncbi:hypothetical protein L484_002975 [Morus notabilis]|uniref:AB hydrolase-1 domain-containing protein n=2 Tax=Morus notabilis TaxID=981085 RepID=W9SNQ0_9ROSA|nr:hypothetical protein L484_002975 [Morus notabilis]